MCGLSISSEHAGPDLFATDPQAVTCEHCRQALSSAERSAMSPEPVGDSKSMVASLIAQLNANDARGLALSLGGELARRFTPTRLGRLHDMFPAWQAVIDELIAEGATVVVRYHVTCTDAFGLLGSSGPATRRDQAIIVRVARHRVVDVSAIVDDFGLWVDISPSKYVSSGCACHPGAPAHFQCTS
jgi:hypothetical protein